MRLLGKKKNKGFLLLFLTTTFEEKHLSLISLFIGTLGTIGTNGTINQLRELLKTGIFMQQFRFCFYSVIFLE
jgi:hypothetical protein